MAAEPTVDGGPASGLPPRFAALHRELGIPSNYAVTRGLPFHGEVDEATLVDVGPSPDGRPVRLVPSAADAWHRLRQAAMNDGVELVAVSGFRSVARQTEIIRSKLQAGRALPDILTVIAAPGFSEHHTGRAIDIGTPGYLDLEENFAETDAFRWLQARAGGFGFHLSYPRGNAWGITYEPWHWLFCPPD
ncbi:MAG: D-alanyl-D-alanine carboxypeptidase family protein [Verrucomicrobia bacterium]|jgi:D-alanyl-D-alanine carboxypeptidase|nr:D-alanyl-D-alanine carboxypeptidase family protein [Verrucomicrobiota bacterium]